MDSNYDIAVIGSGPGGYTAALHAASLDKKVAVIEKAEVGGVCLNRGCIPTKALVASAALYSKVLKAEDYGILLKDPQIEWRRVIERKNHIVAKHRKGLEFLFNKGGISLISGTGRIKEPGLVEIEDMDAGTSVIAADKIIIATGAEHRNLKGFEEVLNSDDVLELEILPKALTIIGGGPIGVEFASIFNAFGTEVTLIEAMTRILPLEDPEISKTLTQIMTRKGITVKPETKADHRELCRDGTVILQAVGRNSAKIGVNPRMETDMPGVYAVGDVTGISMYAHTAFMQGIVAAENACGGDRTMDYSIIPSCIFSSPEIASVGMTEEDARNKDFNIHISKFGFAALGRSSAYGEKEGFVKLIADAGTGKVLGGHIIGENATDLIAEIALAVRKGLTAQDIADTVHAHPTLPEAVWEAARII